MKVSSSTSVNSMNSMTIAEPSRLLSDCIAGDERAIELLVRQHEAGVFRLALSIVGDADEANEITQETFIAALRSLRSYQEKTSFKAWLYTITLNMSRSRLRKQKVVDRLKTALATIFRVEIQKQSSPEEVVLQNEKETVVWKALNELDERHRIIMILRYFQELSTSEIARILSISEGTVHSRLHTARERLRNALGYLHGE